MEEVRDIGISPESAKFYLRAESRKAMADMSSATIRYAKRDRVARKKIGFFKK